MKAFKLGLIAAACLGSVFAVNAYADIPLPCKALTVIIHNKTQMSFPLILKSNNTNNAACPTLQTVLNPNTSSSPISVSATANECDYTIIPQRPQNSDQLADATPLTMTITCQADSAGVGVNGSNFDVAVQGIPSQDVNIADNDN